MLPNAESSQERLCEGQHAELRGHDLFAPKMLLRYEIRALRFCFSAPAQRNSRARASEARARAEHEASS